MMGHFELAIVQQGRKYKRTLRVAAERDRFARSQAVRS